MIYFAVRVDGEGTAARLVYAIGPRGLVVAGDDGRLREVPIARCSIGPVFMPAEATLWWERLSRQGEDHDHGGAA